VQLEPQNLGSSNDFRHALLQSVWSAGQTHTPLEQVCPVPHCQRKGKDALVSISTAVNQAKERIAHRRAAVAAELGILQCLPARLAAEFLVCRTAARSVGATFTLAALEKSRRSESFVESTTERATQITPGHTLVVHVPQWAGSDWRSKHLPEQSESVPMGARLSHSGILHVPPLQILSVGHYEEAKSVRTGPQNSGGGGGYVQSCHRPRSF
jgi:hypothetical protein